MKAKRPVFIPPLIPFTEKGYRQLLIEKQKLTAERIPALQDLQRAREMGDLKENGFYRGAKSKIIAMDRRLRELNYCIRFGKIVTATATGEIRIGSKVTLAREKATVEYTIVGVYESDPSENKISFKSPIGKALIGKKAGEVFTFQAPSGTVQYTILTVE